MHTKGAVVRLIESPIILFIINDYTVYSCNSIIVFPRPTAIVGMAIFLAQLLMAKFCFLQENGLYMALNNR